MKFLQFDGHTLRAATVAMMVALTAPAHGTTITMTGVVPTVCDASFSKMATEGRRIDLGVMTRRCNNGDGYRVVLRTSEGLKGATFVAGSRRVVLSGTPTVVIDSNRDERVSEPAMIVLPSPVAPDTITVTLEVVPKGIIY